MPDTMIERVARALCILAGRNPDSFDHLSGHHEHPRWHDYIQQAHTAITAMREPTRGMLEAARPCPEHLIAARSDVAGYEASMRAAATIDQMSVESDWQAMIDAALEDGW